MKCDLDIALCRPFTSVYVDSTLIGGSEFVRVYIVALSKLLVSCTSGGARNHWATVCYNLILYIRV